jgi:hypothetical protein
VISRSEVTTSLTEKTGSLEHNGVILTSLEFKITYLYAYFSDWFPDMAKWVATFSVV